MGLPLERDFLTAALAPVTVDRSPLVLLGANGVLVLLLLMSL